MRIKRIILAGIFLIALVPTRCFQQLDKYPSEIVKNLGLPKSTVSMMLNDLHQRGIIQKIKKGRENLIRLV